MKRLFKARGVVIGEDCFIGSGVMIMPGARIAAGSVVPPRSLVV
jgi:acetyltransferase-like isoleucine patch superfamily enzyme